MESYFPPKSLIERAVGGDISKMDPASRVEVTSGLLKLLIRIALASTPFDEDYYLLSNPDLEKAWRAGSIDDLKTHYIETGYFEGRKGSPVEVNEEWYLDRYKDIAVAVKEGHISSAQEHFDRCGEREWRAPNEACVKAMQIWRQALAL